MSAVQEKALILSTRTNTSSPNLGTANRPAVRVSCTLKDVQFATRQDALMHSPTAHALFSPSVLLDESN